MGAGPDYIGLAALVTSASTAAGVLYQIWRQSRADRRQERMEAAGLVRDKKTDTILTHVNGMNDRIEQLAYKSGGDDERANPRDAR